MFTGTFLESGQSIMTCGECLVDFCTVIANPPVGEAALDEAGETTTPGEGDVTEGPTPDVEPPSSESPESSPDDTTPDHDDVVSADESANGKAASAPAHDDLEPASTPLQ